MATILFFIATGFLFASNDRFAYAYQSYCARIPNNWAIVYQVSVSLILYIVSMAFLFSSDHLSHLWSGKITASICSVIVLMIGSDPSGFLETRFGSAVKVPKPYKYFIYVFDGIFLFYLWGFALQ